MPTLDATAKVVGITVGLTAIIAIALTQSNANRAISEANRAWLAAQRLEIVGEPRIGVDLPAKLHYLNVGRTPAKSVTPHFLALIVSAGTGSAVPTVNHSNSCEALTLAADSRVAFPGVVDDWQPVTIPGDLVTPEVLGGTSASASWQSTGGRTRHLSRACHATQLSMLIEYAIPATRCRHTQKR